MGHVPPRHGMFGWTDLSTTDPGAAKDFYAALFGWECEDVPAGDHGPYTLCRKDGEDIAGIGAQPAEEREAGVPPAWASYVLVDDVDAVSGRVADLGGTVLMGPMDVVDAGRMSVIQDPTGAVVCLWEARRHTGAGLFNEHGAMTWNELATRDVPAAKEFYGRLLGWSFEEDTSGAGPYHVIMNDGRRNGGVLRMTDEWPEDIPPHWMVYFAVDDVDASVDTVKENGGTVVVDPMDIGVGHFSVVQDPQGAAFTLFTMAGPADE